MASTVWRGRLAFGMVAVPVRLYKAARRERVKFHHVYAQQPEPEPPPDDEPEFEARPAPSSAGVLRHFPKPAAAPPQPEPRDVPAEPESVVRVHNRPVAEDAHTPLAPSSILKGYEVDKDSFVVLKREEIAALRPTTATELEILEFVHLAEIDPLFFDTSYYLVPERDGEKPFALLVKALQTTGDVALGTLAMHGREHAVVIRPGKHGLILHTLFYVNEVRSEQEWHGETDVTPKELELATLLVRAMEGPFEPAKLKDTFEERLRDLIAKRAPVPAAGASAEVAPRGKAPVVDIMEALKRSLEAIRKPVQKDRGAPKQSRPKRTRA